MESRDKLRGLWDCDPVVPSECGNAVEIIQNSALWRGRLARVLGSWRGTPYHVHSAIKGKGADCIGFVAAVVDELYRKKFNVNLLGAPTGSSHQSYKFVEFFKTCRRLWPAIESDKVESGDLIIWKPKHGHGHIFIAGPVPFTIWHCLHGSGICETSFYALGGPEYLTFYRMLNKELWI